MTETRQAAPAQAAPSSDTGSPAPGPPREAQAERRGPTWAVGALVLGATLCIVLMWVLPTRQLVGASAIGLMLVLMLGRLPIMFALGIPGLLGLLAINGPRAVENMMADMPFTTVSNWSLSVLPMFVLMGMLLGSAGVTSRVYIAARLWLGWLPGGLAVGTNAAGGALAAVSGSTMGITYALGRVGVPEMLRRQYDPKLAVGSIIVAGLPGQLIPPSTFLIIVAGVLGTAVGPQLMAGVVPGIGLVLLICALIVIYSTLRPRWAGRAPDQREAAAAATEPESVTLIDRVKSLSGVWPVAVLFVAIFGTMLGGVLTATEAGSLGAFVAILLALYFRRGDKPWSHIVQGATQTVIAVGAIFFVLIGAHIFGQLIAVTGLGATFSDVILDLGLGRVGFLLIVMLVYIVLGMFMDPLAILLLTLPIIQPTFSSLGIDGLWFGVFAVVMGELAILTPPVGLLSFVMHKMLQDRELTLGHEVSLKDVFLSVALFFPALLGVVILMIFVPDLVLWLPSLME